MVKTFIVLIFPEYNDPANCSTSLVWKSDELLGDSQLQAQLKGLYSFVDFFKDEECELIYDSLNADAYSFPLKTLPTYYPARERQFRLALRGLKNWRKSRVSRMHEKYVVNNSSIKDEIRSEIAARKILNQDESYLIVFHCPDYRGANWTISKGEKKVVVSSQNLSVSDSFNWLSRNRFPKRIYHLSPKHGENGRDAHSDNYGDKVSVLLCSREHASELLPKAIGDKNHDLLYYFDLKHQKYMEFKAECKFEHLPSSAHERIYHSYHIEDENDVPKRIKEKLEML